MKSLKIMARKYQTKDGREFVKLSCKGQYLPLVLCEIDTYYNIKFSKKSLSPEPQEEGIYEVAFNDNDIWLDTRAGMEDKNIVRITVQRIRFDKALKSKAE